MSPTLAEMVAENARIIRESREKAAEWERQAPARELARKQAEPESMLHTLALAGMTPDLLRQAADLWDKGTPDWQEWDEAEHYKLETAMDALKWLAIAADSYWE